MKKTQFVLSISFILVFVSIFQPAIYSQTHPFESNNADCKINMNLDKEGDQIVNSLKTDLDNESSRVIISFQSNTSIPWIINFSDTISKIFPNTIVHHQYTLVKAIAVTIPKYAIPILTNYSKVKRIEPDSELQVTLASSIPVIEVDRIWNDYNYTGRGQTIAILDTGIWTDHPDFQGKNIVWKDFIGLSNEPYDDNGHGTSVASVAAGSGNGSNGSSKGVAFEANIVAVKVLTEFGKGMQSIAALALEWIITNNDFLNVTVINLSFGTNGPSSGEDLLSAYSDIAVSHGIVVVVAAGNYGPDLYTVGSPAAAKKVITVGAVDRSKNIQSWSSRGPTLDDRYKPEISAVGTDILAASLPYLRYPSTSWQIYKEVSGTSFAAPMISGGIALLKQAHPEWSPEYLKAAMTTRAISLEEGINTASGYGVANVFNALKGPAPIISIYSWTPFFDPIFPEPRSYGQRGVNQTILVNGTWFTPTSSVNILWDNNTLLTSDIIIRNDQSFSVNISIPYSSYGNHYISLWNETGFILQTKYAIVLPEIDFSMYENFHTPVDFARPGLDVWINGKDLDPHANITIKWDNSTVLYKNLKVDGDGRFRTNITIPMNSTKGEHFISIWSNSSFLIQKIFHIVESTPVSGIISENTIWSIHGSPYIVVGNILVDENVELYIEPGVEIKFSSDYYLLIKGHLNAQGTSENYITFKGESLSVNGWVIKNHYYTAPTSPYSRSIGNITLSYSIIKNGIGIEGTLNTPYVNITIKNSRFMYNSVGVYLTCNDYSGSYAHISNNEFIGNEYGIHIDDHYYTPTLYIENNLVRSNGVGIRLSGHHHSFPNKSQTIVRNNIIMYNSLVGVEVNDAHTHNGPSKINITNNYITRNAIGITLKSSTAHASENAIITINNNDLHSNINYNVYVYTPEWYSLWVRNYDLKNNYWAVRGVEKLDEYIYDWYDNWDLATVYYKPFLNASTRGFIWGQLVDFNTQTPIENASEDFD